MLKKLSFVIIVLIAVSLFIITINAQSIEPQDKPNIKYSCTPISITSCTPKDKTTKTCVTKHESHLVYANEDCLRYDSLDSLKDYFNFTYIEKDDRYKVDIIDYNYSFVTLELSVAKDSLNTLIPLTVNDKTIATTLFTSADQKVSTTFKLDNDIFNSVISFGTNTTMFRIESGNISTDYWGSVAVPPRTTYYGFQMKWNITNIPDGVDLLNASIFLYNTQALSNPPDNDLNLTRINNQTFTAYAWGVLDLDNYTTETWYDLSGGVPDKDMWWTTNITKGLLVDYELDNTFSSWRFIDPDYDASAATTFSDASTLSFGRSVSAVASFGSSTYSNVSRRPYIEVWYDVEANPPSVELVFPIEDANITNVRGTLSNFTCSVIDDTEIGSVNVYSDFRIDSWRIEQSNTSSGIVSDNYTFYQNFSDWFDSELGCDFTGTPLSGDTSQRSIATNGTHWFLPSYNDDYVYVWNQSCVEEYNFSIPSQLINDIGTNITYLAMVGILNDNLYIYYPNGTLLSNCDLSATLSSSITPMGVDFHSDGTLYISDDQTLEKIWHTNITCGNLSYFEVMNGNPSSLTVVDDMVYYNDQLHAKIIGYNLTSEQNVENISWSVIGYGGGDLIRGLATNKSRSENYTSVEVLYTTTTADANELTSYRRIWYEENIIWNCYACDIYSNCAWDTNSTFNVRYIPTPPPEDSCTYVSGNWEIDCGDMCSIETAVNLNGNSIIITGSGMVILNADIYNYASVENRGTYCGVECHNGCFK